MRRSAAILGLGLFTCPSAGFALEVLGAEGFGWSSGSFPAAVSGDTLNIVFVAPSLPPQFGINPAIEEATGSITAIVKDVQHLGSLSMYQCLDGKLRISRDFARDHDYGTNPPNVTAPASFLNGSPCLVASLADLQFAFDAAASIAAFEASVGPMTGNCAGSLPPPSAVLRFGLFGVYVLPPPVPLGYDFAVTISLEQEFEEGWSGLPCFEVTDAEFDVASEDCEVPGTILRDFCIHGVFTEGRLEPRIDPATLPLSVWFERYRIAQTLPAGTFVERPTTAQRTWTYIGATGSGVLSKAEFVLERDRHWRFELCGRGVPRNVVLPTPGALYLEVDPAPWYVGRAGVDLQSDCNLLWYRDAGPRPCGGPATPAEAAMDPEPRRAWQLEPPQPNPFTVRTSIRVHAADPRAVQLAIYDARGTLVRSLHRGRMVAGENGFAWDGRDDLHRPVPAGVYLCRLRTPESISARKLVLVK